MAKSGSYGIKEVADVAFYDIPTSFTAGDAPSVSGGVVVWTGAAFSSAKYTFDSLKVSNIEVTSEETSARGGKGNPELISWSYGKEATFTMEEALINMDTLALLLGGSKNDTGTTTVTVDANTFAGTYAIVGSTVMRKYDDGQDYGFGFLIPKGKVSTSGTLTMSADGDPSTFEMTVKALTKDVGSEKDVLIKFWELGKITE